MVTPEQIAAAPKERTWGNAYQWGKRKAWSFFEARTGWSSAGNTNPDGAGYNTDPKAWTTSGPKGYADPCPDGWRVPTRGQIEAIIGPSCSNCAVVSTASQTQRIGASLGLPNAGEIFRSGSMACCGIWSTLWVADFQQWWLTNKTSSWQTDSDIRGEGAAVRCVAE